MIKRILRVAATLALAIATIACSASASPASSTASAAPAAGASLPPGFPIGSWATTITPDDLRAAGLTEAAAIDENAGKFTLEMSDDGTWTTTQVTEVPVKWPIFRGTWVATGRDTFRQTTSFPADFADDVVDFTWRVDGGNLHLELPDPPDPVLPVIMESHPWTPVE